MRYAIRNTLLGLALCALLSAPATLAEPRPQDASDEAATPATEAEGSDTEPTTEPEPPTLTPAQQLQAEIFVLLDQAASFIEQAEALEEPSEELRTAIAQARAAIDAAADVASIFSVSRLEVLRNRLLDAPIRLYRLLEEQQTESAEGDATAPRSEPRSLAGDPTTPGATLEEPSSRVASPEISPDTPAELRAGARAYFQGDYEGALAALGEASYPEPRAQALTLMLRAAARHGLFLTAGEADESSLDVARANIRECRRLAPDLRPDPALFSPRFVAFFDG